MALAGLAILLFLLLATYVGPRAYYWNGVTAAVHHNFMDMHGHLVNLDTVCRQATLPPQARQSAFLTNEAVLPANRMLNPMRWPHGLYHLAAVWGCGLGVLNPWTTRLTNLLFTVVLVLGVMGLTRELTGALGRRRRWGGLRLGLWAGVITLLTPPLLGSSLFFHLDYPLVAMVIMGLYLLSLTRGLTLRLATINFALWSTLGLFIKLTYALYLIVPVAALLVGLLLGRRWRPALEALAAALVVASLSIVIQDIDLATLIADARDHMDRPLYAGHDAIQTDTLRWAVLPLILTWNAFPWPLLLPAVPGLCLAHLRGRMTSNKLLLLAAIWGPIVLLCLLNNRMERYAHPVYPLLAILAVHGAASLVPRRWLHPVLAAVAAFFMAVLVYCHVERPVPWYGSEEQMTADKFFYETPFPEREHIGWLHQYRSHPICNASGLQVAIDSLMRSAPASIPLVVGLDRGNPSPDSSAQGSYLDNYLHLYTMQQVRGRFVFEADLAMAEPEQARRVRLAPLVLSLQHTGQPTTARRLSTHKVLAQEEVSILCPPKVMNFTLTLLRRLPNGG